MIFKEVIEQILFERGLNHKELAAELGISSVQVENLRTGVTKLPGDRISKKIINYCEQHDIDIDINWNDVLYGIFSESEQAKEYTWIRDLDDDGYVVLRHNECGKKSYVPRQAFTNKNTWCIHCWVKRYVSLDVYGVKTSEDTYRHRFTHKCGHTYDVSFEDIKQKKFRCPICSGYKYSTDNLRKNHDAITNSPISMWNDKEKIISIATEHGFSVEERMTLHCKVHYPSMTETQFALVCDSCFDSKIFNKNESSIQEITEYLHTHKQECEKYENCLITKTELQNIVWIPDVEHILRYTSLESYGFDSLSGFFEILHDEKYSKEVYFAGAGKSVKGKSSHILYHYFNENDENDFINFCISTTPARFPEIAIITFSTTYGMRLYNQLKTSLELRVDNTDALQNTCDEYVDLINYFRKYNSEIYTATVLLRVIDSIKYNLKKDTYHPRNSAAKQLLNIQHCPVCRQLYKSSDKVCDECGFDGINKIFLNKDEYQLWLNEVVLPARKRRENKTD